MGGPARLLDFGVLAPNVSLRSAVVATASPAATLAAQLDEAASKMGLGGEASSMALADPVPEALPG